MSKTEPSALLEDPPRGGIPGSHPWPLRREGIWTRIGPFVAAGAFTVAVLPFQNLDTGSPRLWIASVLTPLIVVLAVVLPWDRWPASAQAVLPLTLFLIVGLLRDASGASDSVYTPLTLLAILWLALYGTPGELGLALACLEAMFLVPYLIEGPPRYPVGDLSEGVMYGVLGLIVGFAIQRLVRRLEGSTQQFRLLSRTDPLTGVANRRLWDERLRLELARSDLSSRPLTVALADLDNFKQLNDTQGHEAGDRLLKAITAAWGEVLRKPDFLARFGGDEFGLILSESPLSEAVILLERLSSLIPDDYTCSVGLVSWDGQETVDELVSRADEALYLSRGRNRIESGQERIDR